MLQVSSRTGLSPLGSAEIAWEHAAMWESELRQREGQVRACCSSCKWTPVDIRGRFTHCLLDRRERESAGPWLPMTISANIYPFILLPTWYHIFPHDAKSLDAYLHAWSNFKCRKLLIVSVELGLKAKKQRCSLFKKTWILQICEVHPQVAPK